jgi:hypothetical protein
MRRHLNGTITDSSQPYLPFPNSLDTSLWVHLTIRPLREPKALTSRFQMCAEGFQNQKLELEGRVSWELLPASSGRGRRRQGWVGTGKDSKARLPEDLSSPTEGSISCRYPKGTGGMEWRRHQLEGKDPPFT